MKSKSGNTPLELGEYFTEARRCREASSRKGSRLSPGIPKARAHHQVVLKGLLSPGNNSHKVRKDSPWGE